MNISRLSWQNIISNPLHTALSLLLMTLGIGIISLLFLLNNQTEQQLQSNLRGIDMVVGSKGSPMQIILSSIYHIDNPTGNIPYEEALKIKKNPLVDITIPLSFGDDVLGWQSPAQVSKHMRDAQLNGDAWVDLLKKSRKEFRDDLDLD